jgi:hypothetical protein
MALFKGEGLQQAGRPPAPSARAPRAGERGDMGGDGITDARLPSPSAGVNRMRATRAAALR